MSISVSEMTIPESFFLLKNGYTAVCIASPLAWFGVSALLIPCYYRMMKGSAQTA